MGERVKGNGNKKSFLLLPNITFTRSIHILVDFGMYIIFKQYLKQMKIEKKISTIPFHNIVYK